MIISDRIGVALMVDAAQPKERVDAMCEAAARECISGLVKHGETIGAFIRPESVWVYEPSQLEGVPRRVQVRAEWCPDPSSGVELRGGIADGEVVVIQREYGARPPRVIYVQIQMPGDPVAYERAGIDSERDRWVYLHRP